jgi:hypothetical protein
MAEPSANLDPGRRTPAALRRAHLLAVAGIVAAAAVTLLLMDRTPICRCGYVKLWHGVVNVIMLVHPFTAIKLWQAGL